MNLIQVLIDAALQLGYHITFEANGDELRKKYNYTFETIVYDRAVVLQRLSFYRSKYGFDTLSFVHTRN